MQFEQNTRVGLALVGALVVHALALVGLALSISFRLPEPEALEARIVAIAVPAPPPPTGEALGPTDAPITVPRFRPREPSGLTMERRQRYGDPALAVWKYLCNRDLALSEAARRECPAPGFGNVDLGVRDPLNRRGDAGMILGNDTATMSLDEAGAKRGWIKPPPQRGQSGLAGKTDQVDQPGGPSIFEDLPSLKLPTERAPDLR